jgi:hypothetical protein
MNLLGPHQAVELDPFAKISGSVSDDRANHEVHR